MKSNVDKKVVGFDMDGVIIDHVSNKVSVAKKFGYKIKTKQTPSDILRNVFPPSVWDEIQAVLFDDPSVALTPPLMPGVVDVLNQLKEKGVPYFLISRRQKPAMAIKLLQEKGLWPRYFNSKNAFFVTSKEAKNEKSLQLGITHYFDDQNSVLEKLLSVKNRFLFDHLRVFKENAHPTVTSWEDISKLI